MTPHALEEAKRQANDFLLAGGSKDHAIFMMLKVLLQHEADKQADLNLKRSD